MSELEQFEAWALTCDDNCSDLDLEKRAEGGYHNMLVQRDWEVWQASRREALEEAAKLVEPNNVRPCDCDVCDCGNAGDMRAVAWWDEAAANANRIRALASGDTK